MECIKQFCSLCNTSPNSRPEDISICDNSCENFCVTHEHHHEIIITRKPTLYQPYQLPITYQTSTQSSSQGVFPVATASPSFPHSRGRPVHM